MDSLEYGMQTRRRRTPARRAASTSATAIVDALRADPARAAGARAPRRRSACSRCCAPGGCRSGRCWPSSSRRSRRASARRSRAPSRAGPPVCTWRCARSASPTATRSSPARSRSSPAPTWPCTSARARCSPTSTRSRSTSIPTAAAAAVTRAHRGAAAGPHLRLPGRHRRRSSGSGCRSSRTPARRSGAVHADGVAGRRPRPPGGVRLLRQQAADDRRGRHGHASPTRRSRSGSTPSATRAARRTWTGSTTTGSASTTACRDIACALGLAQLERLDEMLAGRARGGRAVPRRRWPAIEGLELPCPDAGGDRRGWFVFVVQLPRGVDRDEVVRALARARRSRASRTSRRST